jgi:hypothetical protein
MFQRRQVMQMADDSGILVVGTAFARAYPPGKRAQLVCRRFDGIDACERRYFRRLFLPSRE